MGLPPNEVTTTGDSSGQSKGPGQTFPLAGVENMGGWTLARRRFLARLGLIGLAAASIPGALVGFAPTADANISNCVPGTRRLISGCQYGCIGRCSGTYTFCYFGPNHNIQFIECICETYCVYAKAVAQCYSNGTGVACCVYC